MPSWLSQQPASKLNSVGFIVLPVCAIAVHRQQPLRLKIYYVAMTETERTDLSMLFVKRLPLVSLTILLAAYTTFSWFLIQSTATWLAWALVLAFTVLQALLLTTLFDGLKMLIGAWLKSDVGYFILILVASLGVTVVMVWFKVFGYLLVLIAAEVLARLDLQNAGYSRVQALLILTLFSLSGLAIGWGATFSSELSDSFL